MNEIVWERHDEIAANKTMLCDLYLKLGRGRQTIMVMIGGKPFAIPGKRLDYIPAEYLK